MSPEAAASHLAYAVYEAAIQTMSREVASKIFLLVYQAWMAKAVAS